MSQTNEHAMKILLEEQNGLEGEIAQIEKSLREKRARLTQVSNAVAYLTGSGRPKYNWTAAAINCIGNYEGLLQTSEILDQVFNGMDELENDVKRRGYLVGLSIALNNLCASNRLRKIVLKGVKGHFYGLPDWFNGEQPKVFYRDRLVKRLQERAIKKSPVVGTQTLEAFISAPAE